MQELIHALGREGEINTRHWFYNCQNFNSLMKDPILKHLFEDAHYHRFSRACHIYMVLLRDYNEGRRFYDNDSTGFREKLVFVGYNDFECDNHLLHLPLSLWSLEREFGKWKVPDLGKVDWNKACNRKIFNMMKKMLTLDELLFKTATISTRLNAESERTIPSSIFYKCRIMPLRQKIAGSKEPLQRWEFQVLKVARGYPYETMWLEMAREELQQINFGGLGGTVPELDEDNEEQQICVFVSKGKKRKNDDRCCVAFPFCTCEIVHDPKECSDEFCQRCSIVLCPSGDPSHLSLEGCNTCALMKRLEGIKAKFRRCKKPRAK